MQIAAVIIGKHLRVRSFVMVSDILGCLHMIITSLYRPLQGYFDNIMA